MADQKMSAEILGRELPEYYTTKSFDKEAQLQKMYGENASRRDRRKFERYWNSDQRTQDEEAFMQNELKKSQEAWDARMDAFKARSAEHSRALELERKAAAYDRQQQQPVSWQQAGFTSDHWARQANAYGFKTAADLRKWQQQQGLVADGKFGRNSLAAWNRLNGIASPAPAPAAAPAEAVATPEAASEAATPATPAATSSQAIWRDVADDMPILGSYVTGKDFFTNPTKANAKAFGKRLAWDTLGAPLASFRVMKGLYDGAKGWWNTLPDYQKGGSLRRFQQGGAAPQQDIQQQIVALVQAAMQGDQKATETVSQIIEAAKSGDQQAMQIAQMIQQVMEQMQGQATAAKWGAKLNYIQSLKYAKGGKTCPACEKQVEMKACGGKKAKKRYNGGLI